MKIQIENLKALMTGKELNIHQKANALIEFNKLLEYVEELEQPEHGNDSIADVRRSALVDIVDSDIAIIEALHDLLLDVHGYSIDFIALKRARELTEKMYKAFK